VGSSLPDIVVDITLRARNKIPESLASRLLCSGMKTVVAYPSLSFLIASPTTVIAHRASKIFSAVKKVGRLTSIAFFCIFQIQSYDFLVTSSFKAACTIESIREVDLERVSKKDRN
jgi:hypothetical protein